MSSIMRDDAFYMRDALLCAQNARGETNPNPMVGAVIVNRDGKIIGRGWHHRAGEAHAEVNAIADAENNGFSVVGATLFVTLEPCSTYGRTPPCTKLIIEKKICRVVIGAIDVNPKHKGQGIEGLRRAGIAVDCGVLEAECVELNRYFFRWISTGCPFVTLKMAMTLDGKIATASGDSRWVTGEEARSRVQKLRRMADAILIGSKTALIDLPKLTVRDTENWVKQPLRLVASSSMGQGELNRIFPDGNVEIVKLNCDEDWKRLLIDLGKRDCVSLLIEGGGELAASAIKTGVVDFVEFHVAPKLLGGRDSRPVLGGENPKFMAQAVTLRNMKCECCGSDVIISGYLR